MVKYPLRPFLFLALIFLAACGEKSTSINYGKTTVLGLIKEKGEPLREEKIPPAEGKLLHYPGDEKYQAQGDVITTGFKAPKGDGKTLLYWKHHFKDCQTIVRKISKEEMELACPAEGTSIIYTEGSEFISRVVEYEKK